MSGEPDDSGSADAPGTAAPLPDLERALQLFDETTQALEARSRRLEEVLTVKQRELVAANTALEGKVRELDQLQSYLQLVLQAVGSGVVAVAADGRVTACNPAARALLVEDGAEPIGRDYHDLAADSPVWVVLEQGEAVGPYERSFVGIGGRQGIVSGRASPIRSPEGAVIGAVEVLDDVTEVRRLEQQLERVERLRSLGEMAAGVAHEIRNPLNGIEGFASLLARDLQPDSPQRRYAEAVIDGVRHLNRTVTGLLAFTRPKPPEKRPVPVCALAESCLELLRAESHEADEAPVAITAAISVDTTLTMPCDGTQIRQVVLNLLQNACQICRQAGVTEPQVVLGIDQPEAGWIRWLVDDNGPGVPPADRHRIFTPFHTTREQGTGLGLAVAHTLVGLHGGRLMVTEAPIGGARFVLELPL